MPMTSDEALELEAIAFTLNVWSFDDPRTTPLKQHIFRTRGLVLQKEEALDLDIKPPPVPRLVSPQDALVGYINPIAFREQDSEVGRWASVEKEEGIWVISIEDYDNPDRTYPYYTLPVPKGTPLYVTPELKYQFGVV